MHAADLLDLLGYAYTSRVCYIFVLAGSESGGIGQQSGIPSGLMIKSSVDSKPTADGASGEAATTPPCRHPVILGGSCRDNTTNFEAWVGDTVGGLGGGPTRASRSHLVQVIPSLYKRNHITTSVVQPSVRFHPTQEQLDK
jgi:hypothetical protein